jgi:molybdenum cofactor cytidylyltransferase
MQRYIIARFFAAVRPKGEAGQSSIPAKARNGGAKPSAVLLAAGTSSRFGGTKQIQEIGGVPLVAIALRAIPRAKVRETIVVLGHRAAAVKKAAHAPKGVKFVANPDFRSGMASSIRAGVRAVSSESPGIVLLLADQPFVKPSLILRMLEAFANTSSIVAASNGGVITPPVIFPRRYFEELEGLQGDQGAKRVIERYSDSLVLTRASKAQLADIDTPADLAVWALSEA